MIADTKTAREEVYICPHLLAKARVVDLSSCKKVLHDHCYQHNIDD